MSFFNELQAQLHVRDQPHPDSWRRCYETKYEIARLLQPPSILEFGVRTGYSAFAFLSACPNASYLGIDNNSNTHGGFSGAMDHARTILAAFDARFIESDSHDFVCKSLQEYPHRQFDLVHVDGDHSFGGCLSDLESAVSFRPRAILVDDSTALVEVGAACARFASEHESEWARLVFDDEHNGATLFVPRLDRDLKD